MSAEQQTTSTPQKSPRKSGLIFAVAVILAALLSAVGAQYLRSAPDPVPTASNDSIDPPQRIISLAPSITESLYAIGVGAKVCGVTDYCVHPPETAEVTKVGGYIRPAYERILTLNPDVIFALPEHVKGKDELQKLNLRVKLVNNKSVADILQTITDLGAACDAIEESEALRKKLTASLTAIKSRTQDKTAPRVLVAIGRNVGQRGIADVYVAGIDSFHDELIRMAGGVNAVDAANYPMVSGEGVIRMNPDVIIDLSPNEGKAEDNERYATDWRSLPSVNAVKNNRIHLLGGNHTLIPGPRFIQVVEEFEKLLHANDQ